MTDKLISLQAAKTALSSCTILEWEQLKKCYPMLEVLEELPSAQPEQRWIPFRERSPKEGQQILACSEDGVMWMTAYNSQSRFSGAWMQLPEPYRDDGEAE